MVDLEKSLITLEMEQAILYHYNKRYYQTEHGCQIFMEECINMFDKYGEGSIVPDIMNDTLEFPNSLEEEYGTL